ncbi:hypothetical protein ACT7C8_32095 [Bacillus cereus]
MEGLTLTIQGNTYGLEYIELIRKNEIDIYDLERETYKQFQKDIYTTYKQIRHICNPRACEKTTLETVKKSLREHWLEHGVCVAMEQNHATSISGH